MAGIGRKGCLFGGPGRDVVLGGAGLELLGARVLLRESPVLGYRKPFQLMRCTSNE